MFGKNSTRARVEQLKKENEGLNRALINSNEKIRQHVTTNISLANALHEMLVDAYGLEPGKVDVMGAMMGAPLPVWKAVCMASHNPETSRLTSWILDEAGYYIVIFQENKPNGLYFAYTVDDNGVSENSWKPATAQEAGDMAMCF